MKHYCKICFAQTSLCKDCRTKSLKDFYAGLKKTSTEQTFKLPRKYTAETIKSIQKGLKDAAENRVSERGSFAQFIDEDL